MSTSVPPFVIGVGMTPFTLAGKSKADWPEYGSAAASAAMNDAGIEYTEVDAAVAGYCYGDPTCGQRVVYELGLTGIPILNVTNNCSTGSSALYMAREMIEAGRDCVLAVGFEKMGRRLSQVYGDAGWSLPTERHFERFYADELDPASVGATRESSLPNTNKFTDDVLKMFAYAAREHMAKHGTTREQFARIAHKNHEHSVTNERAAVRASFTVEQILSSPTLLDPITLFQSTGTGDGAAAALVCSERFLQRHPQLRPRAVQILAQSMVTDLPATLEGRSYVSLSGFDMAQQAADDVYKVSGLTAADVDVIELHDCFSCAELFAYEALGLCETGGGGGLIDSAIWETNASGGKLCRLAPEHPGGGWVVNPSGGLESKGHPIGATGLGQAYELVSQLRGESLQRQVDGANVALQHNFGVGGAAVVTLYRGPNANGVSKAAAAVGTGPETTTTVATRTGVGKVSAQSAAGVLQGPADMELPWSWEECSRGWEADPAKDVRASRVCSPGEHDYWLQPEDIVGELPAGLCGTLLRNGPGSMEVEGSRLKHPIDGDGLVGAISFCGDGRVHVRSRYVRSRHRETEAAEHKMLFRGQMGSLPPDRSLLSDIAGTARAMVTGSKPSHLRFRNPSNTNAMYWGGKVLSFYETKLPHWLDPSSLGTIGLDTLGGSLDRLPACAAHFRQDTASNTITMLSQQSLGKGSPQVVFSEYDAAWNLVHQQQHGIDGLHYAHDFVMTPNYYILQMTPFVAGGSTAALINISTGRSSPGDMMRHHKHLPSSIVLVPRGKPEAPPTKPNGVRPPPVETLVDAPHLAPITIADTSPVHIFHFGHAHEKPQDADGPARVEFSAVCLPPPFDMSFDKNLWLSNFSQAPGRFCLYDVDPGGDGRPPSLSRRQIDPSACEFPTAHPWRHGTAERFVYLMANDRGDQLLPFRDIVKCDVTEAGGRQVWYSDGLVGEPILAPTANGGTDSADDDGWLLVQMYRPEEHRSEIAILDARRVDVGPVCRLKLPHRLPFSFHSTYSPELLGITN